jgi:hypothetical protein
MLVDMLIGAFGAGLIGSKLPLDAWPGNDASPNP